MAMEDYFIDGANAVRDLFLTPDQIQEQEEARLTMRLVQVGAAVATVASCILAAASLNVFTVAIAGLVTYVSLEAFLVARNFIEITDNALLHFGAIISNSFAANQVTKNAPLARFLLLEWIRINKR